MLKTQDSIDRLLDRYKETTRKMEDIAETMDPMRYEDQREFTKVSLELNMLNGAIGSAIGSRHSLLKKIISEFH
jgi:hypothetical protein